MKKTLAATAAAAALAMAMAPAAFGATLYTTVDYEWDKGAKEPVPEETVTVDGNVYTLTDTDIKTTKEKAQPAEFTWSAWQECADADLEATKAALSADHQVNEDGYTGSIPCTSLNVEEVYAVHEYTTTQTVTYSGLASNDAGQIPATADCVCESGNTVSLALCGYEWSVDKTDERGIPLTYCCTASYRGVDTMSMFDHWKVTAEYAGTLESDETVEHCTMTVTYAYDEPEPAPAPVPEPEKGFPVGAAVAAVAAAAAFFAVAWFRRPRLTVYRNTDGKEEKIARIPIKRNGAELVAKTAALAEDRVSGASSLVGEIPGRLTGDGYTMFVQIGETLCYYGPSEKRIALSFGSAGSVASE